MSACSKYRCKRYPFGLGTLKPKSWLPNLSYDSRASPPNEANIPPAKCTYLTISRGSLWRFGSLRNCQFSSYAGSGYVRVGSGVGVWAVAVEAARTADATRTKVQRENISVLPPPTMTRGHAGRPLRKLARAPSLPASAVSAPEQNSCAVRQRTAQVAQARRSDRLS